MKRMQLKIIVLLFLTMNLVFSSNLMINNTDIGEERTEITNNVLNKSNIIVTELDKNNEFNDFAELKKQVTDPIIISGNSDFISQASINSWLGDGSNINPFILDDLNIITSETKAIMIQNTDVHFIIQNSVIQATGQGTTDGSGIFLGNVQNAQLKNNLVNENFGYGIYLKRSSNNLLINNTANNNQYGISLWSSNSINNTLINNTAKFNSYSGITLGYALNNNLINNTANDNYASGIGLTYSTENKLINNRVENNNEGISFYKSQNNSLISNSLRGRGFSLDCSTIILCSQYEVENNTVNGKSIFFIQHNSTQIVQNNAGQIIILNSSFITLKDNILESPIILLFSSNNSIINNTVFNSNNGIDLKFSSNNSLINNTITNNFLGISLDTASDSNNIFRNYIGNNFYGIAVYGSNNSITNNSFVNNNIKSYNPVQAYNYGLNNVFEYNFWFDHQIPDNDNNGIVDSPYEIGSCSCQDSFPVTTAYHVILTPPSEPLNIVGTSISTSEYRISWTKPIDNGNSPIIRYFIYRCTTELATCTEIFSYFPKLYSTNNTNFVDSGLKLEFSYFYYVKAFNIVGESISSDIVTLIETINPVVAILSPTATEYNSNSVTLVYTVSERLKSHFVYIDNEFVFYSVNNSEIKDLLLGTHNITIQAIDLSENTGVSQVIFNLTYSTSTTSFSSSFSSTVTGSNPDTIPGFSLSTILISFILGYLLIRKRRK